MKTITSMVLSAILTMWASTLLACEPSSVCTAIAICSTINPWGPAIKQAIDQGDANGLNVDTAACVRASVGKDQRLNGRTWDWNKDGDCGTDSARWVTFGKLAKAGQCNQAK